ncbi:MAG: methyltransferase domain-containing protein [Simkania sp.]|nr:methyltransferase domain-containing protein [Simkania sp.]
MNNNRFDVIGNYYESALSKYPDCRLDHTWLLNNSKLQPSSRVLEISGGTGFLTKKIADIVTDGDITVQDVSEEVLKINAEKCKHHPYIHYILESNMQFPSVENDQFDAIIGLGGFHHIEDQVTFFKAMHQKLTADGILCLGDFEDNSSMQRYFDEKVHYMTSTGHQGLFASESRFINLARFGGFTRVSIERKKVAFCFKNQASVGEFFQLVHNLNQNPWETFEDIRNYFELVETHNELIVLIDYVYGSFQK